MKNEISSAGNLIKIIEDARNNALRKVNEELIRMYWSVGEYLSEEAENAAFGDAYIDSVVKEIQNAFPGIKGFNRRGLYRMKQFYETYCGDEFVSALLTQISWTNHLVIMSKAKTMEERHFYISLCIKEAYSSRELERQIDSGYYERYMLSKEKLLPEPIKGFTRRGLYRMKQFYETYCEDEFVSALLTQISWTNHLLIMSKAKTMNERHFYITLCIKESYSSRELERQIESAYYERYMLSQEKLLPEPIKGLKENPFLDSYIVEFLDLPKNFKEADLRKGLIRNMRDFILEVGKDFTFIDEEYRVQVGGEDFRIDLLFFHRGLQCLVAFELKIGKFKPEYVSKMDFYLEALDRQKKKDNENPSVGMILCASKDDEVVEYAMSRTLSPMMVAEYRLQLPDKTILQKKLQELVNMPLIEEE